MPRNVLTIKLLRYKMGETETLGVFVAPGVGCYTLELPWRDNMPFVSCIPPGVYDCRLGYSSNGVDHVGLQIEGVPNRDHIQMHVANTASEIEGCIAPGMRRGWLKGQEAVLDSTDALRRAIDAIRAQSPDKIKLEVSEV